MSKKEVALYLESVETVWNLDAETIEEDIVLFGFEEHSMVEGYKKTFKTEQVLDKADLLLIKEFIEKTIREIDRRDEDGNDHTRNG